MPGPVPCERAGAAPVSGAGARARTPARPTITIPAMTKPFTHRLRVRYSECDQQNVVFNGHYLFYYDVALTELWRETAVDYAAMVAQGTDLVVAEARLAYRRSAHFDELVDIEMPVTHLGTTSLILSPVFKVGERLVAEGEVRHVFVDTAVGGKREMPDAVRSALLPHSTPEAAQRAGGRPSDDEQERRAGGSNSQPS